MADYFSQGAGANFGPLGYGGGPASGSGNLGNAGYQWSGPTNVGEIAYQMGKGATQANPYGGDAGIRPYNPAISGSAPAPWAPPTFTNTLSPESWNAIAAYTGGRGDLPSAYAGNMMGSGNPSAVAQNYGPGAGPMTSPYGALDIAPNPGSGSSTWDPQNTAYNLLYGQGGQPSNLTGTPLGNNNLDRYQTAFQDAGGWGNSTAGGAMRGITGIESSGGNTFAQNYADSGATGMNQLMNDRLTNYVNAGGGYFDYSPESQAQNAVSEIQGSNRYAPTANALNNPSSSVNQMRQQLSSNYEGLSADPRQLNAELANAGRYGTTLTSVGHGAGWRGN